MSGTFRVAVSKDYLIFAAAHFITFRGHHCEALHGHNYRVGVAVEGTVDPECQFVLDFSVLKKIVRRLVDTLDHRVLLPTESEKLKVREEDGRIALEVFGEPRYVFPVRDCVRLPVPNTTVEMLAEYLGRQVRDELARDGYTNLTLLELEVEESPGQAAVWRASLGG